MYANQSDIGGGVENITLLFNQWFQKIFSDKMPTGAYIHYYYLWRSELIRRVMQEIYMMSPQMVLFHCMLYNCVALRCVGLTGYWKFRMDSIFLRIIDHVKSQGNSRDLNVVLSMSDEWEEHIWHVQAGKLFRAYRGHGCRVMTLLIAECKGRLM